MIRSVSSRTPFPSKTTNAMAISNQHYNRTDLIKALSEAGVRAGDIVFSHIGLGMLGYPEEGTTAQAASNVLREAFSEVLGSNGTWIVPTYTYSYCKNEIYDPLTTASEVGDFTNYFRGLPTVKRSIDPIFSVAAMGPRAEEIIDFLPHNCFGQDCVYDRLVKLGAKICNVGVGFRYATFVHHVEQILQVPYRYPKVFAGWTRKQGELEYQEWTYNVRFQGDNSIPDLRRLQEQARERGLVNVAKVGLGGITSISCPDMWSLCAENIKKWPWFLARGPETEWKEATVSNSAEK